MDKQTKRLEEIRARSEAATPGPWRMCKWSGHKDSAVTYPVDDGPGRQYWVALNQHCGPSGSQWADAQLIAHARADIEFLLAIIGDGLDEYHDIADDVPDLEEAPY